ncbi:MAG: molybdopterin-guanine dinucleotide biosynthesis protein B [Pseudomonadota bacterium]
MNTPKFFGIAGWKNSGKTALVSGLVSEIASRGFTVSTLKHAHHTFDLDTSGTDSFKHREAGAREVILVSQARWAIQHELRGEQEPPFEAIQQKFSKCDLVLVEGYKKEKFPKIEIIEPKSSQKRLWIDDKNVVALACDEPQEACHLPQFGRDQVVEISDFILKFSGISS